jgi:RNA polymerase sigma-70 factor (ECF subfamily)
LAVVFELYGSRVYRLAVRMVGRQADAEDAVQEVFIRAFEQAHRFHGRSGLYTWLYRLAVRHCLNTITRHRRRESRERAASVGLRLAAQRVAPSPVERLTHKEESELFDRQLQALPAHHRACLVLRELEGLSYAQIAEVLEIPTGTVMSRLARARHALRDALRAAEERGEACGNNADAAVVQGCGGAPTR